MTRDDDQFGNWPGFDELRAADPAAGLEVPTEQIWARIRAQIDADAAGTPVVADTPDLADTPGVADTARVADATGWSDAAHEAERHSAAEPPKPGVIDLGARRERRAERGRRRWLLPVAASVAGLLVVGGGAFGAGVFAGSSGSFTGVFGGRAASDSGEGDGTEAQAPTSASSAPTAASGGAAPQASAPATADGANQPDGQTPSAEPGRGGEGGTDGDLPARFTAGELGGGATAAPTYTFDDAGAFTPERLTEVGKAFGLTGPVSQDGDNALNLGPSSDPAAASANLSQTAETIFSYFNPAAGGTQCTDSSGSCTAVELGEPPSAASATQKAQALLAKIMPGENFDIAAQPVDPNNPDARTVSAKRLRGGLQVGGTWEFSFTSAGLQNASGPLAEIHEQSSRALITPAQAVERLNDPTFAERTLYAYSQFSNLVDHSVFDPLKESVPADGAAVPWPVRQITITTATLDMAPLTLTSGGESEIAVPVYVLSNASGEKWNVIALADSELTFASSGNS